ncbi:hypothetical protein AJ88_35230 [Mesorhizobium amorphae CCBAU 01583]|nr:hypothetical protein AJ88_35230 [Mesorhizobium amorphae CCBAU 01583]
MNETRQVARLDPVGIDENKRADPEPAQQLGENGADPAQANDRHFRSGEDGLTGRAEHADLAVKAEIKGLPERRWRRTQLGAAGTYNDHPVDLEAALAGKPDIAGDSILRKYQRTNGHPVDDIQQRRETALVDSMSTSEKATRSVPRWLWTAR